MKKRILLVDDEPLIVEIVSLALSSGRRFDLLVAEDGADALKIARKARPDLVLLDVRMPILDGLEACRILKADPSTSSAIIVMLTARAQHVDVERGLAAGADDYILKPFSPTALFARVAWLLDSSFAVGQSVRLKDGRCGTVQRRITTNVQGAQVAVYHVSVETGTVATVPAEHLEPTY